MRWLLSILSSFPFSLVYAGMHFAFKHFLAIQYPGDPSQGPFAVFPLPVNYKPLSFYLRRP